MTAITYLADESEKLSIETEKAFSEWGRINSYPNHTEEQLRDAAIAYFKASAAEYAVKKVYFTLVAKGLI